MSSYNVDKNAGLIIGDGDFSVIGGTLDITENGVYDVTTYKNVDVDYNVKNEDVTITPELYEQEITPSAGYDGLGVVRVESRPLNLQSKQVAPSEVTTFVTADVGYDGLSSVTVDNVNAEQLGFEKEYYAVGHTFMGLEGTYNPFPEHSVGGIYITEVNENGFPAVFLIKNLVKGFLNTFQRDWEQTIYIEKILFDNCPAIEYFPTNSSLLFNGATGLIEARLPHTLKRLSNYEFNGCRYLKIINIPSSLTSIGPYNVFGSCESLEYVTIENGFNCNGLNLSASTRFTAETIVACLEALADRTGETAYTITFGSTNLNKLTAEQIAIATNKNWNLS